MAVELKVIGIYTLTTIFLLTAAILLCLMVHLVFTVHRKCKTDATNKRKVIMFFLITTLIAITSFFLSILFIIAVMIQIILIDAHKLHPQSNWFHYLYYTMFEEMEYMIAIFDSFGHLCMLTIFMLRFQICFKHSIFAYSKILIRSIHIILILLVLSSLIIIVEIIRDDHDVYVIIISEIIWELSIEFMCLWLLYLFVSKLYKLVKLTLTRPSCNITHKRQQKSDLMQDIRVSMASKLESTIPTFTFNRSNTSNITKPTKMTIDGKSVEPFPTSYNMDNIDIKHQRKSSMIDEEHMSYTINATDNNDKDDHLTIHSTKLTHSASSNISESSKPQIVELVNTMNKLSLLVVISVFGSILSLIGNVLIEIHELNTIQQHTVNIQSMFAFLLPVLDMVITSFMLYLQFNFTQSVYSKMCYHFDIIFLKCCLKINTYSLQIKSDGVHSNPTNEIQHSQDLKSCNVKTMETEQTASNGTTTISSVDDSNIEIVSVSIPTDNTISAASSN